MGLQSDICSLEYFAGTLATAYRGRITSLIIKDFCMSGGDPVLVKGTVLAMPPGGYEASLVRSGTGLARSNLTNGYFELRAPRTVIEEARELQIDILQSGRHIGTFLLKQERSGGVYSSATELSEDLAGMDLQRLTAPLRNRVGLLRRAEELISLIHSTKKEWTTFSEKLNSFAVDVFWSAEDAFYGAFDLLVHFSAIAAENADLSTSAKAVSNVLDLLGLALENEHDLMRLRGAARTWTENLAQDIVDLSADTKRSVEVLSGIGKRVPEVDFSAVARSLIVALRRRIAETPFLDGHILLRLAGVISNDLHGELTRFGEPGREKALRNIDTAEELLRSGDRDGSIRVISGIDADALDDRSPVAALFSAAEKGLTATSADAFGGGAGDLLVSANGMSIRAQEIVRKSLPVLFEKLAALERYDVLLELLGRVEESGEPLRGRIMLDPRTARAVMRSGDRQTAERYKAGLRSIIIPAARVRGISEDTWQEIVDPLHLERMTAFLDLLMEGGEHFGDLLAQVIANVAVGQAMIPDDRLFQRSISAYLNSRAMEGSFLLSYLLLQRFPVYFNEVGATDRIRDHSTELDSPGNDSIIYFLRKQIHVNASSRNIELLEGVLQAWTEADPEVLRGIVPSDILAKADRGLLARYADVARPFLARAGALDASGLRYERLLSLSDREIEEGLAASESDDAESVRKIRLLCELYKLIVRKYALVERDGAAVDARSRLTELISRLRELKRTVLAPGRTEPQESLYFKRHIAFGIPSVLGTYHEIKFDALARILQIGHEVPVLLEQVVTEIEVGDASPENVQKWLGVLGDAWEVLKIYGMQNAQIDEFGVLLGVAPLNPAQVVDVLKMWQRELAWQIASLGRTFQGPILRVLGLLSQDDLPPHLRILDPGADDVADRQADTVMRDILSGIPGLIESDRLLEAIVGVLRVWPPGWPDRDLFKRDGSASLDFYDIHELSSDEALRSAAELGSKAKNLVLLWNRGFRVPAGIVLPASRTVDYDAWTKSGAFHTLLRKAVAMIEAQTRATFGGSERPLFLSVRSGSYPSMPGILSSILYCGMNDATTKALARATGDEVLAWDSYRRFLEHFAEDVAGLNMRTTRKPVSAGVARGAAELRALVSRYRSRLSAEAHPLPDDPYEQLRLCVRAVYASWYSIRARQYRAATGTAEGWGTAVILMEMIPGNRLGSGASMFFTRDPFTFELSLFGESRENASGNDIASGRLSGRPLSQAQAGAEHWSVEKKDPELYEHHIALARAIEDAFGRLPQEVEVTYTRGANRRPRLFVLQTRRMEPSGSASEAFAKVCGMEGRVIGRGVGANGGALSGVASFEGSPEQVEKLRERSGLPVILLRRTASTNDVLLMPRLGGIVTASGGVTSHAAVLAQKFGLSAVVGCSRMVLGTDELGRPFARFGAAQVREGDAISIDGVTGLVFQGSCFETITVTNKEAAEK